VDCENTCCENTGHEDAHGAEDVRARCAMFPEDAAIHGAFPEALVGALGPDRSEQELSPAVLERRDLWGSLVQLKLQR
jgi:hypothetical protein